MRRLGRVNLKGDQLQGPGVVCLRCMPRVRWASHDAPA